MNGVVNFPVEMRIAPTALEQTGTASDYSISIAGSNRTATSVAHIIANQYNALVRVNDTTAGLTTGQAAFIRASNTSAFLGWSAEL
jgi:hypothetical protein